MSFFLAAAAFAAVVSSMSALFLSEQFLRSRCHLTRLEAELSLELLERRRRSEQFHADDAARSANI